MHESALARMVAGCNRDVATIVSRGLESEQVQTASADSVVIILNGETPRQHVLPDLPRMLQTLFARGRTRTGGASRHEGLR